jgi:aspartate kinase
MKRAPIVAKFGGTSVKDADCIRRVVRIVRADSQRTFVVVSAPAGVTNALIEWCTASASRRSVIWNDVEERFVRIAQDLETDVNMRSLFREIEREIKRLEDTPWLRHYVLSRGEWLNAHLVAAVLGYSFLDARSFIAFKKNGQFDFKKTGMRAHALDLRLYGEVGVVVPGFYGGVAGSGNAVCTFSRGGSDITGAIVAALVGAGKYENWTDVDGVYAADPRVVPHARKNDVMTYRELRELTYMGAKVFHEDAVGYVRDAGIPIHVRCTTLPDGRGTLIVPERTEKSATTVTGVAGKNGFSTLVVDKYGMDDEVGFLAKAASIFTANGLSVNVSSSIDSLTFIVESDTLASCEKRVRATLQRALRPDAIRVRHRVALVCTVGEGMVDTVGVSAKISGALAAHDINIVLELQGGSQINVIRGVDENDLAAAIRAIYGAFA